MNRSQANNLTISTPSMNDSGVINNILCKHTPLHTQFPSLPGCFDSNVSSMTRMGVMHFQTNDFRNSQDYFLLALQHLESRTPGKWSQHCKDNGIIMNGPRTSEVRAFSMNCDEGIQEFSEVVMFSEEANMKEISMILHHNIAQTHLSMKNYSASILWFRRTLDQSSTFCSSIAKYKIFHNIGYCNYHIENYECAMEYFHHACQMLRPLGLSDHIMATPTYNCIGVLFFNNADPDADSALKIFQKTLEIYHHSPNCYTATQMATLLNNLGRVFYLKGEFKNAAKFYQSALAVRRQELGSDSIDVAATCYNLGNSCHRLKNLQQALEYYREFLRIAETCLELHTREVAYVYKCLAEILQELKEFESALMHFNKALEISKELFGESNREIGCILNKAGNLCFEQGKYEEALKYYVWGLDIENKHPERDERVVLVTLTNIAQTHKQLGRMEKALNFYREAYKIQTKGTDLNQLDIASTLSSIGLMLYHLKQYEDAFDAYQEALLVRRDYYRSDDHADIASTLNAIGLVMFKQGMYDLCTRCFQECLGIRRKLFGPDHGDVAMAWYNLASVSFETGDDEIALQQYEEALRIERKSLGDQHPDIILTMIHLGQVKQNCGLLDEALATFNDALRIHRHQTKEDHMREARIQNFIGNCFLQKGDIPNMIVAFSAATRLLMSTSCVDESLAIKGYNLYGLSKLHPECAPVA